MAKEKREQVEVELIDLATGITGSVQGFVPGPGKVISYMVTVKAQGFEYTRHFVVRIHWPEKKPKESSNEQP